MHIRSDQLRSSLIRLGRPFVRNIYQFKGTICADDKCDLGKSWGIALEVIYKWLEAKYPVAITRAQVGSGFFEKDHYGQKLECVSINDPQVFSVRFQHQDKNIAGRVWTTDISIVKNEVIALSIRVTCATLPNDFEDVPYSRPKIMKDLAQRLQVIQVGRVDGQPINISSEADLDTLEALLVNPERRMPVLMLTEVTQSGLPFKIDKYVLDPVKLAWKTLGLAYVVTMPHALTF